jgi:hypothetical protein
VAWRGVVRPRSRACHVLAARVPPRRAGRAVGAPKRAACARRYKTPNIPPPRSVLRRTDRRRGPPTARTGGESCGRRVRAFAQRRRDGGAHNTRAPERQAQMTRRTYLGRAAVAGRGPRTGVAAAHSLLVACSSSYSGVYLSSSASEDDQLGFPTADRHARKYAVSAAASEDAAIVGWDHVVRSLAHAPRSSSLLRQGASGERLGPRARRFAPLRCPSAGQPRDGRCRGLG